MKTNFEIKHRFNGNVLFSFECESIRECVVEAVSKRANLQGADLQYANLQRANLQYANLQGADLQYANLQYANLQRADLQYANLQYANLQGADLQYADLQYADLQGANLDMSCLPLWCGSLKMKTSKKLRVQIAFHFLSLIKCGVDTTEEEKEIYENLKKYANEFHRTDVERL
jgi:hypothetical protein